MKQNQRWQALCILSNLLDKSTPLNYSLQSNDIQPLTKEICFGVSRHYFRLQAIADQMISKRPKSTQVWICILMGIYQLHYLRAPDYAVVKESVDLLSKAKCSWGKGMVNAVLRRFCREKDAIFKMLENTLLFKYNHPQWFIARLKKSWPQNWESIIQANDEHPPMTLRVNNALISTSDYLVSLEKNGINASLLNHSKQGISLKKACPVSELPNFKMGFVSVQDESAQLAVSLLSLKPGLRVLDACAAPGGKTCHILETHPGLIDCVALDLDANRLIRVQENLDRLHLKATLIQGDGRNPEKWWDGKQFDRILLDAPCSATGVIRRHPDIKLLRQEQDINDIVKVQHELLSSMWPLLAPGGIMLYATCSIICEENELQVSKFITEHENCHIIKKDLQWGNWQGNGWQIFPGEQNKDGFFYSLLAKENI